MDLDDRYLKLLQLSLTDTAHAHSASVPVRLDKARLGRTVTRALRSQGLEVVRVVPSDGDRRQHGRDWPRFAQTMVGTKRLTQLRGCVEQVLVDGVPGDMIETGVWRGGASIMMRGVLAVRGVSDRRVFVADSFEGLPPPDVERNPADRDSDLHERKTLAITLPEVRANFERYGLLDEQVVFVKGWFRDTLPELRDHSWAIIRLDGDMYESTMDGLANLYPGLSPGGYLIVDDYGAIEACRQAVHDYRREHGINPAITSIDSSAVYWRRAV